MVITLMIGLVVLFVVVAVIWTLSELVDFVRDLGPRGCLQILVVLLIFGLLAYGFGSVVQIVIMPLLK